MYSTRLDRRSRHKYISLPACIWAVNGRFIPDGMNALNTTLFANDQSVILLFFPHFIYSRAMHSGGICHNWLGRTSDVVKTWPNFGRGRACDCERSFLFSFASRLSVPSRSRLPMPLPPLAFAVADGHVPPIDDCRLVRRTYRLPPSAPCRRPPAYPLGSPIRKHLGFRR